MLYGSNRAELGHEGMAILSTIDPLWATTRASLVNADPTYKYPLNELRANPEGLMLSGMNILIAAEAIINSTDHLVADPYLGHYPQGVGYSPTTTDLYISNGNTNNYQVSC